MRGCFEGIENEFFRVEEAAIKKERKKKRSGLLLLLFFSPNYCCFYSDQGIVVAFRDHHEQERLLEGIGARRFESREATI